MITRKEYMSDSAALHQKYYFQFANKVTIGQVLNSIGKDRIRNSNDKHFNDIPLKEWDDLSNYAIFNTRLFREINGQISLADKMCCLKSVAAHIRDNSKNQLKGI